MWQLCLDSFCFLGLNSGRNCPFFRCMHHGYELHQHLYHIYQSNCDQNVWWRWPVIKMCGVGDLFYQMSGFYRNQFNKFLSHAFFISKSPWRCIHWMIHLFSCLPLHCKSKRLHLKKQPSETWCKTDNIFIVAMILVPREVPGWPRTPKCQAGGGGGWASIQGKGWFHGWILTIFYEGLKTVTCYQGGGGSLTAYSFP